MARKPKPKPDDAEQSKRFVETAIALESNENLEQFEGALTAITKPKPKPKPGKSRKPSHEG